ncbi:hypothetical protein ACQEV9_05590 [Streptomyces chartreusis]|uniref:hypothetical protein n=1 Tax=Streptomyces chartreusis TaxID=1969 RepID=UPI003D92C4C4
MHQRTPIERTSGAKESVVHALMMTETGVPVVVGLLARVNPLVLTTMGAAAIAHGATAGLASAAQGTSAATRISRRLACVIGLGVAMPYAKELRRCVRARPGAV